MAEATLCLLNGERADRGLPPLSANPRLADAATAYAHDLVAGSYFSHTGRDGSGVLDAHQAQRLHPARRGVRARREPRLGLGRAGDAGRDRERLDELARATARTSSTRTSARSASASWRGTRARADGRGATYATEFGAIEGAVAGVVEVLPDKRRRRASSSASGRGGPRSRAGLARLRPRRIVAASATAPPRAAGAARADRDLASNFNCGIEGSVPWAPGPRGARQRCTRPFQRPCAALTAYLNVNAARPVWAVGRAAFTSSSRPPPQSDPLDARR